ncbi:MAG: nucleoside triphosphate pyrophosphohydrolase [Muribaculaceae bacterium]|nr:nucleoside triphosphate pyrophosphohydrolase [Muribaculaceae bacterium]
MLHTRQEQLEALGRIIDTLDILRVKCPWDAKQTNESLRPNTIEEVYELAQALLDDDASNIRKELGDVLLHVLFYAKIGSEKGQFDIADVADALNDKLIYRHPHVFGTVHVDNAEEVTQNWEQLKLKEKDGNRSVLAGVPSALPALVKAYRVQEKAANVGFDWEEREQVWAKVREEISETADAIASGSKDDIEAEFGDLFFSLVNAARLYGVNPENALERTDRKFISRFNYIETKAREAGRTLSEMTLDEMDALWNEAKANPGTSR